MEGAGHAGGIGPLTAQATEVTYSDTPRFRVTYHPRKHVWKVAFALERRLENELRQQRVAAEQRVASDATPSDLEAQLDDDDRQDAIEKAEVQSDRGSEGSTPSDAIEQIIKQAKLMITGDQFSTVSLAYLVDALRVACDIKPRWQQTISEDDVKRVTRLRQILAPQDQRRRERSQAPDDRAAFMADLGDHAAGYLAPLIEHIVVGWPSEVLKSGIDLVDLPGVGVANDLYRDITRRYVRDRARAVILVVDRGGPTESSIDLLRTSGYWDRLVGSADDPSSDPCNLVIAVTKVDDVANAEWASWDATRGDKPKKREVFASKLQEFKPRMRAQITEQLSRIGGSANESVRVAREHARSAILDNLEVYPLSAPEYARLVRDDDDDRSMLKSVEESGVPALQQCLMDLGRAERERRERFRAEVTARLGSALLSELQIVDAQWRNEGRAAEEAQKLEAALQKIVQPKQEEYDRRVGAFREFLDATVQARIETLVLEAKDTAEVEVRRYLASLQGAHWATLRATVRRGGTYAGGRIINLPDDITGFFQEPMAAVWGQKLLRDIRKRTTELASDIEQLVAEICDWARADGGATVNKQLLQTQQDRIAALSGQMKQVGKEAVDELRKTVKSELSKQIRKPIEDACKAFVQSGDDIGPGVKSRILELFDRLAHKATVAAQDPAVRILQNHYASVRIEIQTAFSQGGNPVQDTADLIVEKHELRIKRSDAQKRRPILDELEQVLGAYPKEMATESNAESPAVSA